MASVFNSTSPNTCVPGKQNEYESQHHYIISLSSAEAPALFRSPYHLRDKLETRTPVSRTRPKKRTNKLEDIFCSVLLLAKIHSVGLKHTVPKRDHQT